MTPVPAFNAPMKAVGATRFLPASDPNCFVSFETPTPEPGPRDLLVKVRACGINPVDTKIRKSLGDSPLESPRILGYDAAGTIEAVGPEVTGFSPGDDVFYAGALHRPGSNAEFQTVDHRVAALKPSTWSFEEAAAVPIAALTAWELLFDQMGAHPEGRDSDTPLLVINGAGGVGSALIPLAKSAGLTVVATASRPETTDWCESLGADHVINHRQPLRPQCEALGIPEFPLIANLYSTELYWETTADLIAPYGSIGLIVQPAEKLDIGDPLKAKCVRIAWEFMAARAHFNLPNLHIQGRQLTEIAARCNTGHFPKILTRTIPSLTPESLREAHLAMENATAFGKWALSVQHPPH